MSTPPRVRLTFLDALRGVALILMVLNHTSRDWMDGAMTWPRYYVIYGSLLFPASIFLFLVGFCLPIPYHRAVPPPPPAAVALRSFRRGIVIVAAGYLLNLLITPERPLSNGGVLQTIGLGIIVLGSALPLLRHRWGRFMLLGVAAVLYVTYVAALPTLVQWAAAHPVMSRAFFNDFPPWPWLSVAMIGLVLGWTWLEARARGNDEERQFFVRVAVVGVACLVAYAAWEWWIPTTPRFGFRRDFTLNDHWTPRGVTILLIGGTIACLLASAYWLLERKRLPARWLVVLGQTALFLYFVHQVIELTLVNKILGLRFNDWPVFWIANVVFVVLLVALGHLRLAVGGKMRKRAPAAAGGAPAR